ncbi:MAG: helix-turn-helix domain-containing protein [Verrucomicrobiota bacterium]
MQPHICALPLSLSRPEEKGGRPAVNGRAFRFPLAEQAQELVLTLPAMRSKMESERREILVKLSTRLIEAGFSLNKAATFLEVPASQLCTWRKKYNQGGVQALRPIYGRLSKKHPSGATGCTIGFTLKP